ncbi:MAG: hypothetical protein FJZ43_05100 [Candidatus Staskawiczbacteria bacterium]|nr:hypothetical protein [Candidatus Staskawiczbacteria bacterium]
MAKKDFVFDPKDFIEQYEIGNLINIYSINWLENNKEDFEFFFKTKIKKIQKKLSEHLFILHLDKLDLNLQDKLIRLTPKFKHILNNDKHLPDFIFFNIISSQILCIGLGRKNRIFIYDVMLEMFLDDDLSLCSQYKDIKNSIISKFCEFDLANIFLNISNSLSKLGKGYYYNEPKIVVDNRSIFKFLFPKMDVRTLNTRDF